MPRIIDFKTKIEEFRRILIKYHGIPSVKEDRVAYANLNYYLKHHNKEPGIKSLIDEFNLEIPKHNSKEDSLKIRLIEIRTILEKYGRIPKDNNDYYY